MLRIQKFDKASRLLGKGIEFRESSFDGLDVEFSFQSKMVGSMSKFELLQFDKSNHRRKELL